MDDEDSERSSKEDRSTVYGTKKLRIGVKGYNKFVLRYHTRQPVRVELLPTHDPASVLSGLRQMFGLGTRKATNFLEGIHVNPGWGSAEMYHLTNTVTISSKPWVVSFEHYLPRWNPSSDWGTALLARPQCRRIVAMSEYALRTQESKLERHPRFAEAIRNKIVVLHPAQRALIAPSQLPRRMFDKLRFAFVGSDFFRKGGREILLAFNDLLQEGAQVHLTIVSRLDFGDYASQTTSEDARWAQDMIHRLGTNVTYTPSLPNEKVLDLFLQSHVSLLPTYHDTYGYALLESQAVGCPVISTSCCALPEINGPAMGWMIQVPTDALGDPCMNTPEQRSALSRSIREGLYATIKEICCHPECIAVKGANALRNIIQNHDPVTIRDAIEGICIEAAHSGRAAR